MYSKASSIISLALLSLVATSTAFNITNILSSNADYATFNDLLTQTGLAQQINSRQTITVLVVANGNLDMVSGKDLEVVKRILSTHVILDYYDEKKISSLPKNTILTTLFQTTGNANSKQGFLTVEKTNGGIMFGSAASGAQLSAQFVRSVASQPYNISVLEVSETIEAPGIENMAPPTPGSGATVAAPPPSTTTTTPNATAPAKSSTTTPPPTSKSSAPVTSPAPPSPKTAAPPQKAQAPASKSAASPSKSASSPSEQNTSTPPAAANAPAAPESDSAPAVVPSAAPSDDHPAAEAPKASGSSRAQVGGVVAVVGLVAACVMGF